MPGDHGDHGDHGTSVSDEIDQKTKVGQNTRFFLRFFFSAHFDHWTTACVPGDHGTCVPKNTKWVVDHTIFIVQTCSIAQIEDFFIVL